MNEKDWKLLSLLKEELNISKVARQLYFTQPALSARIKLIEKEFGCKIIERHRTGITFTEMGETVTSYAIDALKNLEKLKDNLNNSSGELSGTLKIGCSNSIAELFLPKIFKSFKSLYPKIDLSVNADFNDNIYKDLLSSKIHIALIRGNYPWDGIKVFLYDDPFCVVNATPFTLDVLPTLPGIFFSAEKQFSNEVNNWWVNTFDCDPIVSMNVSSLNVGLQMVENGLGYSILTSSRLHDNPNLHSMNLELHGKVLKRETWMFLSKSAEKNNAAKCFLSYLENNYLK